MTDCYETFIPPLRPARPAAASTATMATATAAEAATDFLTATGFRSRPPSERAIDRATKASSLYRSNSCLDPFRLPTPTGRFAQL